MSETQGSPPSSGSTRAPIKSPRAALEPEPAPPAPGKSRRVRNQWVVLGNLVFTVLLVGLIAALFAFQYVRQRIAAPGPLEQDRTVFIPRGSTSDQIAETLERNGVISSSLLFSIAVQARDARSQLKWGEYLFPRQVSISGAMGILIDGKPIEYRITIPEGLTSEQIVQRLRDNDVLIGDIARVPREGALLPDTYRFTRGTTRQQMLDQMTQFQSRLVAQIWARRSPDLPLRSPEELVTLASIVEKETGKAEERARVAGVFVNRLNRRMRLQSDPTIIYGIVGGRGSLGRPIFRSDIDRLTPYNTYQIDGLPPTPIANPGRASMEAVANPLRHREIFFVADGTGGHAFAETLEQHNRNVARWRQIEREQQQSRDASPATPAAPVQPTTVTPRPPGR